MNRFVIADSKRCIGCRTCEVACVLAHGDGNTASLSATQFAPRLTVVKSLDVSTTVQCRHCEDAPCANVCPNGAMTVISKPVVRISHHQLMGSGMKAEAHKCDLCQERAAGPACVQVCPTKALHLVNRDDIDTMIQQKQRRAALDDAAGIQF
ncbi:electron transport protein HydN [Symbiopectobacterium purcellii]|uniref:Electron transport protein HydN n=1 Tax=Symbiopectobacterium purcellii TaxID=2871826 RepID=A0ABX9AQT2_9ENTR|nr:electron transport protein HydN [Symbiopectobacterium purcellii]QZN97151.1 electron transport protein HydN [Symbiopectobacterium purcellii]